MLIIFAYLGLMCASFSDLKDVIILHFSEYINKIYSLYKFKQYIKYEEES